MSRARLTLKFSLGTLRPPSLFITLSRVLHVKLSPTNFLTCPRDIAEDKIQGRKKEKMVHADASTFAEGVSKEEALQQVLDQAAALFDGQRNWVANLANTASLLWHAYKSLSSPSKDVNWAGFYVVDPTSHGKSLILGPFMGQVACQTIDFGRGVCGTAAATKDTQLVPDVDAFPGHIACDGASKSEVVVPVTVEVVSPEEGGHVEKKVVGIIDIDCAEKNGFDETDKKYLEELAVLLGRACDW